ncbi:MAG: hypothetical protein WDO73_36030 [Ignavibacteriota bacterium]
MVAERDVSGKIIGKTLKNVSLEGIPVILLLLRPLWMAQSTFLMVAVIGLLVGASLLVVWRSSGTGRALAVPIGWAVLALNEGVVGIVDEFLLPYSLGFVYVLFSVTAVGVLFLTFGVVRLLLPSMNSPRSAATVVTLAYRLVIPALLAMPLVWMLLNQLRRLSYSFTGGEPNEFHFRVTQAQGYVWWALLLLLPFAFGVTMHSVLRSKHDPTITS